MSGHLLSKIVTKGPDKEVKRLLDEGTDPNYGYTFGSRSMLSRAAEYRKHKISELLLDYGADVDAEDEHGRTPLSWAAQNDSPKIVRALLENGAKIDSRDSCGRTPLSWAAEAGNPDVVDLLLSEGADRGLRDRDGLSPLLWSYTCGQKYLEAVQALLKIDPFVLYDWGWSKWNDERNRPRRTKIEERFLDEAWHVKPDWDWTYDSDGYPIFFNIDGEEIKGIECKKARLGSETDLTAWRQWY
jgi:ankyrin repeat protein